MIKKVFHIALSMILLVATTGMAISKHYCGDELAAVELGTDKIYCCDTPEDMPEDCCHDEQLTFQAAHDFQLSSFQLDLLTPVMLAMLPYFDLSALFVAQEDFMPPFDTYTSPPIAHDLPVMLQSFLI